MNIIQTYIRAGVIGLSTLLNSANAQKVVLDPEPVKLEMNFEQKPKVFTTEFKDRRIPDMNTIFIQNYDSKQEKLFNKMILESLQEGFLNDRNGGIIVDGKFQESMFAEEIFNVQKYNKGIISYSIEVPFGKKHSKIIEATYDSKKDSLISACIYDTKSIDTLKVVQLLSQYNGLLIKSNIKTKEYSVYYPKFLLQEQALQISQRMFPRYKCVEMKTEEYDILKEKASTCNNVFKTVKLFQKNYKSDLDILIGIRNGEFKIR